MRRFLVCCALLVSARRAVAQTGVANEGALELIRPIGARSLGMGLVGTASAFNTDAVWVNPALITRTGREASFDFRNQANAAEAESDVAGVLVWPFNPVGSVAVFARYINNGSQDVALGPNNQVGTFTITDLIIGASLATTFFDRLAVGFTAKQERVNFSCTGECTQLGDASARTPTANALDFGSQFFVTKDSSISVGAAVMNIGPKFQLIDSPQADPLPSRASIGVQYTPKITAVPGLDAHFAADIVTRVSSGTGLGYRAGAELSYLKRYQLRAGYIKSGPVGEDTPTIGLGLTSGKIHIDLSQMMTNLGGTGGSRPTFLTLRFDF